MLVPEAKQQRCVRVSSLEVFGRIYMIWRRAYKRENMFGFLCKVRVLSKKKKRVIPMWA